MLDDKDFLNYIKAAEQSFTGWDFSYVTGTGRIQEQLLTWSYGSIVIPHVSKAQSVLDMGTGGGEFISKLAPFTNSICATEAYKPNVPIARKRLEPLGVKVIEIEEDNKLPFDTGQFDLIINRHEAYSPSEVRRLLTREGIFITQQVGGLDCVEINEQLGAPSNQEFAHWKLDWAVNELKQHDFNITLEKEEFPVQRFYDIGALVYYLNAIPWQVPDFDVDRYLGKLYKIHQMIQTKGYFDVKQHRFMIKAVAK
ncbi:class I SAM-dependent methyltransferase [Cytobacillus sp. FJAT-54145]|uniref:Class I SAM-dependent methyltransferase n=1 Tax=Cytobacillus spartinae TaxID=3299023 RepID=A0ABW6KDN3_9BACI